MLKIKKNLFQLFEQDNETIDQNIIDKLTNEVVHNFEKYGLNSLLGNKNSGVSKVNFNYTDPETKKTTVYTIDMTMIDTLHTYVQKLIIDKDPTLMHFKKTGFIPQTVTPVFSGIATAATDANGNFFINPLFFMQLMEYSIDWYSTNDKANDASLKAGLGKTLLDDPVNNKIGAAISKYVWGYAFVLIHEACHRIYNHFYRAEHKIPPIPNYHTDANEQMYVNVVQDMEINREIEKIFPELGDIVNACHGYRAPMDSNTLWEMMYNANVGRNAMNKQRPPSGGKGAGKDAMPQQSQSGGDDGAGKGPAPKPTPLNDIAQKGFEDGWNKCIEDILILMGGSFKNTTTQEWKAIVDNINNQIDLMNNGVCPLPALNVNALTKFIVEQRTFKDRFNMLFGKKIVLNENISSSVKIPSTYAEGYSVGYFECWQRIMDEWNPSAAIAAGDEQMKKLGENYSYYDFKNFALNESALYASDGINGWCLQNVDKLKTIPSNPKLKDHDLTDKLSKEEEASNNNEQDIPKVPAPQHDYRRVKGTSGSSSNSKFPPQNNQSDEEQDKQDGQNNQNKQGNQRNSSNGEDQGFGQPGKQINQGELAEQGKPQISQRLEKNKNGVAHKIIDVNINSKDFNDLMNNSSVDNFGHSKDVLTQEESDNIIKNLPRVPSQKQSDNSAEGKETRESRSLEAWKDAVKNSPAAPGKGYTFSSFIGEILKNLYPKHKEHWKERLKKLMREKGSKKKNYISKRDNVIMSTKIRGISTISRTEGDYDIEVKKKKDAIASIFYLIDNSGSFVYQGKNSFEEAWAQIIDLEKVCKVKKSLATYFSDGINPDDEYIRVWNYGTKPDIIYEKVRQKTGEMSGGTDVVLAIKQIKAVHNRTSNMPHFNPKRCQHIIKEYSPIKTTIMIVTDGELDSSFGRIDWQAKGFNPTSIVWIFINTKHFLDNQLHSICSSVYKFFNASNIVEIPIEDLV